MFKRLSVRDLGPIETADLRGDVPVTLVLGPNESGKSTLKESLEVLYFGTRGGLDVKGNAALTRAGAKGWSVEVEFDDGKTFRATRSQRPSREELQARFGDPRVFASLCQASRFLEMDPAKRKRLIADLAASDTLELGDKLESRNVDPSIVRAVRAGNMNRAHTLAVELRRAEDRKINALSEIAEGEVPLTIVKTKKGELTIDTVPLDTVESGIARLSKRRDEIRAASYEGEAYERAQRDADAAREELADLTAEADWSKGDSTEYLDLGRRLDKLRGANMIATSDKSAASVLDDKLKSLLKEGGACPTCMTPLESDDARKAIGEARLACSERISNANALVKSNDDGISELEAKRKEMLTRKEAAASLATTRTRLEQKVETADTLPERVVPAGNLDDLNEEIKRLGHMRDVRREYDTRIRDRDRAQERVEKIRPFRDKLASLVKELDPSAMDDEGAALTQINGLLASTCGKLGVPVVLNDGYDLSIHGRPVGLAARSAQLRAGFGIACALSVMADLGIVFLDDFEALDDTNRKRVLGLLKELSDGGLITWALIAAVKETPKKVGNVDWIASVGINNGIATYL